MTKKSKGSSNSSETYGNTNKSRSKQISPSLHWCFTLNNYSPQDISDICSNSSIARYVFQEETGKEGTQHLQGYLVFKTKVRPMEMFNKKIHWEKCRNKNASEQYCKKKDTRSGKLYIKGFDEPVKILDYDKMYTWQKLIVEKCKSEPDDRSINVYIDKKGARGKTVLCKYLCNEMNALCVSGKSSDIKYGIVKYKEMNHMYPKIILIDVPRSHCEYINYESIEKVKDGIFFCGKYESCQVIMNCPHVFLFMNETPDVDKMSIDRWKIIVMEDPPMSLC